MNIEELVIAAQAEEAGGEAFTEICGRFAGLVKKYAGQAHVASIKDEAMAEGWLAVVTAVSTYEPASGVRFAGYVESRVKYAVWNLFKRERRRWQQEMLPDSGGEDEAGDPVPGLFDGLTAADNVAEEVEMAVLAAELRQAVTSLPEKQRLAIVGTLLNKEKLSAVAAKLNVSPQAVYGLRERGLARLKTHLQGMYQSERR